MDNIPSSSFVKIEMAEDASNEIKKDATCEEPFAIQTIKEEPEISIDDENYDCFEFSKEDDEDVESEEHGKKKRVRKSNMVWDEETTLALIKHVEKNVNLWDSNSVLYKNRDMNNYSWQSISLNLGISKREIILRWCSVRGNYQTHFKKIKYTKSGRQKVKRTTPLFTAMKFLDPVLTKSPTVDTKVCNLPTKNLTIEPQLHKLPTKNPTIDSQLRKLPTRNPTNPAAFEVNLGSLPTANKTSLYEHNGSGNNLLASGTAKYNTLPQTPGVDTIREALDILLKNSQSGDEWNAFGNMIAANARTWAVENLAFARRYKAALSAVNAQYELKAAELKRGAESISVDPK